MPTNRSAPPGPPAGIEGEADRKGRRTKLATWLGYKCSTDATHAGMMIKIQTEERLEIQLHYSLCVLFCITRRTQHVCRSDFDNAYGSGYCVQHDCEQKNDKNTCTKVHTLDWFHDTAKVLDDWKKKHDHRITSNVLNLGLTKGKGSSHGVGSLKQRVSDEKDVCPRQDGKGTNSTGPRIRIPRRCVSLPFM